MSVTIWKGWRLFSKLNGYFIPEIKGVQISDIRQTLETNMQMWIMPLGESDSCETAAHYQKDKINSKQQNN